VASAPRAGVMTRMAAAVRENSELEDEGWIGPCARIRAGDDYLGSRWTCHDD